MKIKVWGGRGSIPAPLSPLQIKEKMMRVLMGAGGVDLENAGGVDLENADSVQSYLDGLHPLLAGTAGGNTSCLEIQVDGQTVIVDAGSGIRALGEELMRGPCGQGQGVVHLFFSHTHWDHIQGLPFFLPAFVPGNKIIIYSVHDTLAALTAQMEPATFPVSFEFLRGKATFEFVQLRPYQRMNLGKLRIANLKVNHPGDAYAFRFEHEGAIVVYASDAEYKQLDDESLKKYIKFYSGADLLIVDAQFSLRESISKRDWGHSSALIGADLARKAGVKRLMLSHHDPTTSDDDLIQLLHQAQDYQQTFESLVPCEIMIAQEGQILDLQRFRRFSVEWTENREIAILVISNEFDQAEVTNVLHQIGIIGDIDDTIDQEIRFPKLIVDLTGMDQLGLACLRALIDLRRYWVHSPFVLAGVTARTLRVINLANFTDEFIYYRTIEEAAVALEARDTLNLSGALLNDRYLIEEKLDESRGSVLFKAFDNRLKRFVSLKVFSRTLSRSRVRALLHRAQEMARFDHPAVATVMDWDSDQELTFLVLEYAGNSTLRKIRGQLPPTQIMDLLAGVLNALDTAHGQDLYHGNLRPENIILHGSEVKILDFGLTVPAKDRQDMTPVDSLVDVRYLAPEQLRNAPASPKSDLYALGLILYEVLVGEYPFKGGQQDIIRQQLNEAVPAPRSLNQAIPPAVEHLILTLLAKEPEDRPASAKQVREIVRDLKEVSWPIGNLDFSGNGADESGVHYGQFTPIPGTLEHIDQLLTLWNEVKRGSGQVIVFGGDVQAGKTYLLRPMFRQIRNATVIFGHGQSEEGGDLQVFSQVVREYLSRSYPVDPRDVLGDSAASLTLLAPMIAQMIPDVNVPQLSRPDSNQHLQQRQQLWRDFMAFLERASVERPWVLVLDQLHRADPASLDLVKYLAYNIADLPVLLVCLYSKIGLDSEHPMLRLERNLAQYPTFHQIDFYRQ